MKVPSRSSRLVAFAAIAALGLTACGGQGGSSEAGTYKMGVTMALSGANAALGQDFVRFIEYGIEDANKQYAGDDIKIEMVSEDTEATAEVGLNALNKVATVENAPAVFTAWSAVVKAMAPAAEDLGVALFNIGANSPELEGAGKNLRNFFPLSSVDIRALATYMAEKGGKKSAAIIAVNNATGEGTTDVYTKAFEAAGGKVVAIETIEQDAVDASSQVAKILAANPDTIHVHPLLGEAVAIFKALKDQGADVPITSYSGAGETVALRKASGDAMNGLTYTTTASIAADDPKVVKLVERFKADFGREPAGISYDTYMYDSAFFYAEMIKQLLADGEKVTGENLLKVVDKVREFKLPLSGSATFTDRGTVVKPVLLKRIEDASKNPAVDPSIVTLTPAE